MGLGVETGPFAKVWDWLRQVRARIRSRGTALTAYLGVEPSDETEGSALKSLLDAAIDYDRAGAVMPAALVLVGAAGAALVIGTGLFALAMPSAEAIESDHFFLLLGGWVAGLDSFLGSLASDFLIAGGALVALDAALLRLRTPWYWRYVIVIQLAAGFIACLFCSAVLALVLFNLGVWLALIALVLAIIGVLLSAMAS